MTDCSMCNSGLNDLATSSYNKRLHREAKMKAAAMKPKKRRVKPTKSVQAVSCPSDKFTGGCTQTTYKYPNGTERVVTTRKVAKKKIVTSIGTFSSVAAYKKAKEVAARKLQRQTELERKKAMRAAKAEASKNKKLEAQRKRLNAKRLKGIKMKEKAFKAEERKQKQALARANKAFKQMNAKPRKPKQFKNTAGRTRISV